LRIVKVAIALLDHLHVAAQREVHCVDITQLLSGLGAAFYVVERGKKEGATEKADIRCTENQVVGQ